ncbi:MAG: hypothetical protein ACLU5J_08275 [Christensenellales bacterium]
MLNGLGIKVKYKDIQKISSLAKVKEVAISELYNMPQEESSYDVALKETGILATNSNYKGEGMIVAILDTGLDTSHQAFQKQLTDVALTYQNIESISEFLYPNVANGGNYYQAEQFYKSLKNLLMDLIMLIWMNLLILIIWQLTTMVMVHMVPTLQESLLVMMIKSLVLHQMPNWQL